MNKIVMNLLLFTILIPAIVGLNRWKRVERENLPFIYCVWFGCLCQIISFFLESNKTIFFVNNVYGMAEACFYVWYFKRKQQLSSKNYGFQSLLSFLIATWMVEHLIIYKINVYSLYWEVMYAIILVILSIRMMINVVLTSKKNLRRNPDFLIPLGTIFYFTTFILIDSLSALDLLGSFDYMLFFLLYYPNALTNLLFALAIYVMPKKQEHRNKHTPLFG